MRYTVLGPVAVVIGDDRHTVRRAQTRGLLGLLLLNAGHPVSLDAVIEALWGGAPPSTARSQVQGSVYAIRRELKALGAAGTLTGGAFGYLLEVPPEQVDALSFARHVERARAAAETGDRREAVRLLRAGLALWHGDPLADAAGAFVEATRARLTQQRLAAAEELADLQLHLGQATVVTAELGPLVDAYPMRERLRARLMTALSRTGRQVEALQLYRDYRDLLADREGLDPGTELVELELAILRRDPHVAGRDDADPPPVAVAPARPEVPRPAQLPADVVAFTGRADHLRQLDAFLPATRAAVISVIAGTAGVGKTALAVHWAHRVRHRFPDGQLYANLRGFAGGAPARPVEVLARFLRALGVGAARVPVDLDEAAALFRSLLAERRLLVVLDDAAGADQVRPLLPGSPECLALVTSRHELDGLAALDGASRIRLDVLDPDEARDLLTRLLGPERTAAEPAAVVELAELCAHLPLALRLAAAHLGRRAGTPVAEYVAELRSGDRLTALAVSGDSQAGLRVPFELSYARLPVPARRLFRFVGLVPGPDVTAEAAAALVDATREEARHLLDRLTEAHLLDRVDDRYTCHDLLRRYAQELAEHDDGAAACTAAQARLFDHYLYGADAAADQLYPGKLRLPLPTPAQRPLAFVDDVHAAAWLDAEQANLVAAITYTAAHGPRPIAWLLADTLRGYFHLRLHAVDWLTAAQSALDAATAENEVPAQTTAQLSLASMHWRRGAYEEAIDHHRRAYALATRCGWAPAQAAALGNLGTVYAELGRLADAAVQLRKSLAILRGIGDPLGVAVTLGNLGLILAYLGELAEAAEYDRQAIARYREAGVRNGAAITLANLGTLCHELGRTQEGTGYLRDALAHYREVHDRPAEVVALNSLAEVYSDTDRVGEAFDAATTALALAREVGRRSAEAGALLALGYAHYRAGEHQRAVERYQQTLDVAQAAGDRSPELRALVGLARAYRELGDIELGHQYARQALQLARQSGYRLQESRALTVLAALSLDAGHPQRALAEANQALTLHRRVGHPLGEAQTLSVLGDIAYATDGPAAALPYWRQAATGYAALGMPDAAWIDARLAEHAGAF